MESPTTYHALATHLHTLLETESYSKTTMKDMEFILDSFRAYMIENDLDVSLFEKNISTPLFSTGTVFFSNNNSSLINPLV